MRNCLFVTCRKVFRFNGGKQNVWNRRVDFCLELALKTHIPVYSTSSDKGLGTRKPTKWQRLNSQLEVRIRNYLSTGKYYFLTIIKSQVYYP